MISALILVFSLTALTQFGFYCWRVAVITLAAADVSDNTLEDKDFQALATLNEICPALNASTPKIGLVRAYYRAVEWLSASLRASFPSAADWAEREMATCARYMAVVVDQRLQRNQACFAALRSF
jgi:hypothetical protein